MRLFFPDMDPKITAFVYRIPADAGAWIAAVDNDGYRLRTAENNLTGRDIFSGTNS